MCEHAWIHVPLVLRVKLTHLLQLLLLLQELQLLLIQRRVLRVGPHLLVRVIQVLWREVLASIGHETLAWAWYVCRLLHEGRVPSQLCL